MAGGHGGVVAGAGGGGGIAITFLVVAIAIAVFSVKGIRDTLYVAHTNGSSLDGNFLPPPIHDQPFTPRADGGFETTLPVGQKKFSFITPGGWCDYFGVGKENVIITNPKRGHTVLVSATGYETALEYVLYPQGHEMCGKKFYKLKRLENTKSS